MGSLRKGCGYFSQNAATLAVIINSLQPTALCGSSLSKGFFNQRQHSCWASTFIDTPICFSFFSKSYHHDSIKLYMSSMIYIYVIYNRYIYIYIHFLGAFSRPYSSFNNDCVFEKKTHQLPGKEVSNISTARQA